MLLPVRGCLNDLCVVTLHYILLCLQSILGHFSVNVKRENETDQSKSPTSSGTANLIGQFGFPFYVHGTSNLKSTVTSMFV